VRKSSHFSGGSIWRHLGNLSVPPQKPEPPRLTLADIARVLREWGAREEQAEGGGEPEHRAAAAWRPAAQAPATQAAGEASGRG
jgi:hypothetical protein